MGKKNIALILAFFCSLPSLSFAAAPCATAFDSSVAQQIANTKIIVLSAPSGGGKTTLAQMLLKDFPHLAVSVSSTTRAPRGQEKNGVDYHFLSKEEFKAKMERGEFVEWAEVHGNYYGTDIKVIESERKKGHSVLSLVDIKGADNLKKVFPKDVVTVFISPPDMKILEARLRGRGTETEEAIQIRLKNARAEMQEAPRFDHIVVNDDLALAYQNLSRLLREHIP